MVTKRAAGSAACKAAPALALAPAALVLLLLLLAPTACAAVNVYALGEDRVTMLDAVDVAGIHIYPITAVPGTAPAIIVTLTPQSGSGAGDVDLHCNKVEGLPTLDDLPLNDGTADFQSVAIGVNQDQVYIPPVGGPDDPQPVYMCAVYNMGVTNRPVEYTILFDTQANSTGLVEEERALAEELYDRCCQAEGSCGPWKEASLADASEASQPGSTKIEPDTDLCQFGSCSPEGHLTALGVRGWQMVCPFPGDLLAQFTSLRYLLTSFNNFTGDMNEAARNLSSLPNLQEWAVFQNKLTGRLDDESALCTLAQGTLEVLLIDGNSLSGTLPACLFDGNSTLHQFAASSVNLTGGIPEAFGNATKMQLLSLAQNSLSGTIPASLAAVPSLVQVDLSNNKLSGPLPLFGSSQLVALKAELNQLTGAVPDGYAGHPTLFLLDLGENQLTSLPSKWGQPLPEGGEWKGETSPLTFFRASYNKLEGGFPAGLASYPVLTSLLLHNNRLSGPLPDPGEDQFPSLRFLDVAENNFSGSLGQGWQSTGLFQMDLRVAANPRAWNLLNLTSNALTGQLPAYMADPTDRVEVQYSGNSLQVPTREELGGTGQVLEAGAHGGGGGLSTGDIVGIAVGAVAALALAATIAVVVARRRRSRHPIIILQPGNSARFARFSEDSGTGPPVALPHQW